jgi:uncharacterized pyridoxal phosphate-containing UPF0001 family protein
MAEPTVDYQLEKWRKLHVKEHHHWYFIGPLKEKGLWWVVGYHA